MQRYIISLILTTKLTLFKIKVTILILSSEVIIAIVVNPVHTFFYGEGICQFPKLGVNSSRPVEGIVD